MDQAGSGVITERKEKLMRMLAEIYEERTKHDIIDR